MLAGLWACSPSGGLDAAMPDAPELPCAPATDSVDLVFMIDSSGSMAQEQTLLAEEMTRLVSLLATGNRGDDPMADVAPVRSIRIATVTSDMGAGDVPPGDSVPSCNPGLGEDGRLEHRTAPLFACTAEPSVLIHTFENGVDDVGTFGSEVACAVRVGTGGCGFEQQLEAVLKGLSPASPTDFVSPDYVPPTFWGGTTGHAGPGGANEGFLRPEAVLAIVMFTDEEDCSVPDYDIFYMNDPDYAGNPLNLRCHRFPDSLYPVERYVDGFLQLRTHPSRLVYATMAGVPVDLSGDVPARVLEDERMQYTEEAAVPPQRILPSCDTSNGVAFPPRRMVAVAEGIEEGGGRITVQSLCGADYASAIDAIVAQVDAAMAGTCE